MRGEDGDFVQLTAVVGRGEASTLALDSPAPAAAADPWVTSDSSGKEAGPPPTPQDSSRDLR